ncbi:MAG: PilZ domain-containing protein [Tepidisphaeraceae bacterium]|jgi:hypothetical protein
MNFAETRLAEAISLLQNVSANPARGDKRRSRRMSLRVALQIRLTDGEDSGKSIYAELHDISARGLAVRVKRPLESGTSFVVQLPVETHDKPLPPLICRVVHCLDKGEHTFHVGAEFIGQLGEEPRNTGDLISEEERIRNSILS